MPRYYYVEYRDDHGAALMWSLSVSSRISMILDAIRFNLKSYEDRNGLTAYVCEDPDLCNNYYHCNFKA